MLEFQHKQNNIDELNQMKKKAHAFSILRGLIGVCVLIFIICLLSLTEYVLYGLLSAGFFLLFMIVVVLSNPTYKRIHILENKEKVYVRHEQRRIKEYSHFSDNGNEFKDKEDYKLQDLDVFGPRSLYQYLSEAKTPKGRLKLANQLKNPKPVEDGFIELEQALANSEDSIELEAALMEFKKNSYGLSSEEFTSNVQSKIEFKVSYLPPLISFIGMLIYLVLMLCLKLNPYILLIFVFSNLLTSKLCLTPHILKVDPSGYRNLSEVYYDLAQSIAKVDIDSSYYKASKAKIMADIPFLKKIRSIYSILHIRRNIALNIVLNLVCSFDFFVYLFVKLKIKNGICVSDSLEALADIEVALSFKNIGFDNEVYCVGEKNDTIIGVDMFHPLVKNCKPNSIELTGGVVLTGSNMSGKTTFMRTLGICELLYNAGSLVPAKSYKSYGAAIYTSLRANDMLQEGISTFYAEIKRMQSINQAIKEKKCLILVDEIFKGTNAKERIMASIKVMEKLNQYQQFFIVSTHDFELCETKDITNYHFEESYIDDTISFDYQIKSGPLTKGNAIYLLKMSGIIES